MSKPKGKVPAAKPEELFGRIVSILEQARGAVVRAVNTNMVLAYWLIGREIVRDLQAGEERAEYGKQMLADLSSRLTQRYGSGFSVPNLQNFRKFYLAYSTRVTMDANIQYPVGTKSVEDPISYPMGTKSAKAPIPHPTGAELAVEQKSCPPGSELPQGFSPLLSWSHYRVLMRVDSADARVFYEREAIEGGWDKRTLERQVHTQYYDRCLHSQHYVRMFDGLFAAPDDNPTIGLILCTEKSDTVARYSVLNDRKQIFASKYLPNLPSEEQLRLEISKERRLIEEALSERQALPEGEQP